MLWLIKRMYTSWNLSVESNVSFKAQIKLPTNEAEEINQRTNEEEKKKQEHQMVDDFNYLYFFSRSKSIITTSSLISSIFCVYLLIPTMF